jgi:hypothetical protein
MADYEKLGFFYLGRDYDQATRQRGNEDLLYDSRDLVTHAVCVGMTGSGKTGLCLALLEEAAIDQVPVIAIDPKGDVGNLLLAFPELRPEDFRPWVEPAEAERQGLSVDELAAKTADLWRKGLAEWAQDGARIEKFRDAARAVIYTPGSTAGLPISVLKSFDAPQQQVIDDSDLLRDRIGSAVSGLLSLVGIDADPLQSREHVLISQLLDTAWRAGQSLDLPELVRRIQKPPLERVGSIDLETYFPAKARSELALRLNNLLASPGFAAWMEGEPLSIQNLLYTPEGKPRISILSIAHLSDVERMFFVTVLLNELVSWVRTQSGTSSLRAILYMDEVFGYFPPTANPPSKKPMLTLLKQARAYGLGVVLATQNPVDLDYKGLSNAGTWFLGRLQTERDKMRVLDGLEGASAAAGSGFNRSELEATLAGLGKRVFLLNNVHEDRPRVFETRWCLSYLRGPLTRAEIQKLTRERAAAQPAAEAAPAETSAAAAASTSPSVGGDMAARERPLVAPEVEQVFLGSAAGNAETATYRPGLYGKARVHFADTKARIDHWQDLVALAPVGSQLPDHPWDEAWLGSPPGPATSREPVAGAKFDPLPGEMSRAKSYADWAKELASHLYREYALKLWSAPAFKQFSRPGESEAEFRVRLMHLVREQRDAEVEKLRKKYAAKSAALDDKIQRAQERVAREKAEFQSSTLDTAVSVGASIFKALFGRKLASVTNVRGATTAARSASRSAKQHADIERANAQLEKLLEQRRELEDEFEEEVAKLEAMHADPEIVEYPIAPRKRDIEIVRVALAWISDATPLETLTAKVS